MKIKIFLIFIFLIFLIGFCSAVHNITGIVNDAKDGTLANDYIITLWNSLNGLEDNLTDIIGPNGNSGEDNNYLIDCELLGTPCSLNDNLSIKVFNNGSDYVTEILNVTVTGASEDSVGDLTLNSPPTTFPASPTNFQNLSIQEIEINCSISDLDSNLYNATLYGNWSGGWHENETKAVSGDDTYILFTKTFGQGTYKYGCKVTDNLSISTFSQQNNTFTIDLTDPIISSVQINESSVCGSQMVRVNCTATDQILGVNKVIIQAITPSYTKNHTGIFLTGNTYYSDVWINETGSWKFNCIVNDSAGNQDNLTSDLLGRYSADPDFYINYQTILLNNTDPIENQSIIINATIENLGCGDASNVLIGFFKGDPDLGGINLDNDTISINGLSSNEASIFWNANIGINNIFVFADYGDSFSEENESDNKANKSFSINSWQEIYGNISINKLIGNVSFNLTHWLNETNLAGNVFITDSECNINWLSLQAIGKNKTGEDSSDDFSEIDTLLGMSKFGDSVSILFSDNQVPKQTETFLVHQKEILNVPVINSSENSNFITGILWDYSDDSVDGEYDSSDQEDLIFVTKVNKEVQGDYGVYDYEIEIPVKLREYKSPDYSEIYFYYDLN